MSERHEGTFYGPGDDDYGTARQPSAEAGHVVEIVNKWPKVVFCPHEKREPREPQKVCTCRDDSGASSDCMVHPREPQKDETPQCGELPPMGTRQERCELQVGHPGNHMAFGGAQIVASWPKREPREPHAALIAEIDKELARIESNWSPEGATMLPEYGLLRRCRALVEATQGLPAKWREEADGVTAMGYSQQGERMRDCADELDALLERALKGE